MVSIDVKTNLNHFRSFRISR